MNFNEIVSRAGTDAFKVELLDGLYGAPHATPLWVADMDFPAPPPVVEALRRRADHPIFGYTMRPKHYFNSMCRWFERRHGWHIDPDWCLHSPMMVTSLAIVVEEFTARGEKVLIQTPVYQPFFEVVTQAGRALVTSELVNRDGYYEIDFDRFERDVASGVKLFILCSPHNPVGRVWLREELVRMVEICARHNVLVVSDEIHCDIVFPGSQHLPLLSLDPSFAPNVIACVSPSKTFNLAGLCASALVIPHEPLRSRVASIMGRFSLHLSNVFSVDAFQTAFDSGGPWLDELLVYLQDNRELVHGEIERNCPQIKGRRPEGTYLSWLDFRVLGIHDMELKRLLAKEAGVALEPGSKYGTAGAGFMRLNFASPRPVLTEAMERLCAFVRSR